MFKALSLLLLIVFFSCSSSNDYSIKPPKKRFYLKDRIYSIIYEKYPNIVPELSKEILNVFYKNEPPFMEFYDFYDMFFNTSGLVWVVKGKKAEVYRDFDLRFIFISGMYMEYYEKSLREDRKDTKGKKVKKIKKTLVRANFGLINGKNQNAYLFENVYIKTYDNKELFTDYLVWDNGEQVLKTDAKVVIKKDNRWLKGKGFVLNYKTKEIKIIKPFGKS